MAAREYFEIRFNDQTVVKHKWNSATKEVEYLIRRIAVQEGQGYRLLGKESIKDESGFYNIRGHRTWIGENGSIVRFDIQKVVA